MTGSLRSAASCSCSSKKRICNAWSGVPSLKSSPISPMATVLSLYWANRVSQLRKVVRWCGGAVLGVDADSGEDAGFLLREVPREVRRGYVDAWTDDPADTAVPASPQDILPVVVELGHLDVRVRVDEGQGSSLNGFPLRPAGPPSVSGEPSRRRPKLRGACPAT